MGGARGIGSRGAAGIQRVEREKNEREKGRGGRETTDGRGRYHISGGYRRELEQG